MCLTNWMTNQQTDIVTYSISTAAAKIVSSGKEEYQTDNSELDHQFEEILQ